jgi:hypothetical protein
MYTFTFQYAKEYGHGKLIPDNIYSCGFDEIINTKTNIFFHFCINPSGEYTIIARHFAYEYFQEDHKANFRVRRCEVVDVEPRVSVKSIIGLANLNLKAGDPGVKFGTYILTEIASVMKFLLKVSESANNLIFEPITGLCPCGYSFKSGKLMLDGVYTGVSYRNGNFFVYGRLVKNVPYVKNLGNADLFVTDVLRIVHHKIRCVIEGEVY